MPPEMSGDVRVPLAFLRATDLPWPARIVWIGLRDSLDTGAAVTINSLAARLGMSESTLKRHLAVLCDTGYATSTRTRDGNAYTVHTNPIPEADRHRTEGPEADQPAAVYRTYDGAERLLYVGMAGDVGRRLREHRVTAPWWPYTVRHTVEHYPSRPAAAAAELAAIRTERPLCNVTGAVAAATRFCGDT